MVIEDEVLKPFQARLDGDVDSVQGLPIKLTRRLVAEVDASAAAQQETE